MRRIIIKPKVKPVCIMVHPSFYDKMETMRRAYNDKGVLNLSQVQLTNIIAKRIRTPVIPNYVLEGGKNVKKKRRSY